MSNISTLSWENKLLFEWVSEWLLFNAKWAIFQLYHGRTSYFLSEWVSDCCLMPSEQYFNFIMGEQVTFEWVSEWLLFNAKWAIFQLYHERTSYFLSEWVSDCCLMPSEQYFNFIMGEQVTFWVSEWVIVV